MRLAIIGSRDFTDFEFMETEVKNSFTNLRDIDIIVSGGARGADMLAERFTEKYEIPTLIFKADWDRHGKKAGYLRNADIVKNADYVMAFWDGYSKGTQHSIELAQNVFGVPVKIINYVQHHFIQEIDKDAKSDT